MPVGFQGLSIVQDELEGQRRERCDGWLAHGMLPVRVVSCEDLIPHGRQRKEGRGAPVLLLDDRIARGRPPPSARPPPPTRSAGLRRPRHGGPWLHGRDRRGGHAERRPGGWDLPRPRYRLAPRGPLRRARPPG